MNYGNNIYGTGNSNSLNTVRPGTRAIRIPIATRPPSQMYMHECDPIENVSVDYLELNCYRATMHFPFEYMERYNLSGRMFSDIVKQMCLRVNNSLNETQPVSDGHPIFINDFRVTEQIESQLVLVDVTFFAVQNVDVEQIGKPLLMEALEHCLRGC